MILKSYEILNNPSKFLKHNLFLIYGENYGLKKEIRTVLLEKTRKEYPDVEFLSLYENEIISNEENFYNTIYSGSLFSSRKIITINNCTDKITNTIQNICKKYPENISLIIFSDKLEKKSKLRNFFEKDTKTICIPCYQDTDRDLRFIANSEFKKNNIMISNESINLLIDKSNYDRNNLKNEIEKIKSYTMNKKKLELDEIKLIISFAGEHKSDSLINECLCGNIQQYKKILSELYINTIDQIYLLRILSHKIQKLLSMKKVESDYDNLDNLLNATKPPIFWKDKPVLKKQLIIWKIKDLKIIVSEINDTEILCKKNPQLSKLIFFNFFTRICTKANNFS